MATTFSLAQHGQTSFKLPRSSPLDTLVRKSSARRTRQSAASSQQYPAHLIDDYADSEVQNGDYTYEGYTQEVKVASQHPSERQQQSPVSPLLHGGFARGSMATASITGSYADTRTSVDSRSVYQGSEYSYLDAESVYSQIDPAIRDSWRSGVTSEAARPYDPQPRTETHNNSVSEQMPTQTTTTSSRTTTVPTVVVSSADADNNVQRAGRTPVVRPITSNFSRPVRSSQTQSGVLTPLQITTPPLLPQNSDEQKRRVLERNANRTPSLSPSRSPPDQQMKFFGRSKSPLNPCNNAVDGPNHRSQPQALASSDSLPNPYAGPPAKNHQPALKSPYQSHSPSLNSDPMRTGTSSCRSPTLHPDPHSSQPPTTSQIIGGSNTLSTLAPVALPRFPPERSDSPASLYSTYSYYNFESPVSSPAGSEFSSPRTSHIQQSAPQPQSSNAPPSPLQQSTSPNEKDPSSHVPVDPQTPHDFLSLGIQKHEANRLKESAMYFEKSAKENGGCGVGMLMWGLTLRHGWGCEKNEKVGFKWLRKAAEHAVVDLESARKGNSVDTGPVQVSGHFLLYLGIAADQIRVNSSWLYMKSGSVSFTDGALSKIKRWLW